MRMTKRMVLAGSMVAALASGSAADHVTSNRGVACRERASAAGLAAHSQRNEHADWAKLSDALLKAGKCVLLLQGTLITRRGSEADGLAEIVVEGQSEALWIEAANVATPAPTLPPVGPPSHRVTLPSGTYIGCESLATLLSGRTMRITDSDEAAYSLLMEREIGAGRCKRFAEGSEVILKQDDTADDVARVRQVGQPDLLWIDLVLTMKELEKNLPK